ncbi:unnamed protein product, partial [Closterium sp. NIES-53]
MGVAGGAHDGFLLVARPAAARAAPKPPPPPPYDVLVVPLPPLPPPPPRHIPDAPAVVQRVARRVLPVFWLPAGLARCPSFSCALAPCAARLLAGVDAVKPAAPVARETVAPVAHEPVAPVARESVAPAARLAAEPVTPVSRVPVAPFASVPVAPVAHVPAASAATHHLLSSHGPSSSSLALSYIRCVGCTPSGGVLHMVLHYRQLG